MKYFFYFFAYTFRIECIVSSDLSLTFNSAVSKSAHFGVKDLVATSWDMLHLKI